MLFFIHMAGRQDRARRVGVRLVRKCGVVSAKYLLSHAHKDALTTSITSSHLLTTMVQAPNSQDSLTVRDNRTGKVYTIP